MTSERASAVNRAIAEALGLEVRQNKDKFEQTKYHIFPAVEDFLPDYTTDMNAAMDAAVKSRNIAGINIHINNEFIRESYVQWMDKQHQWHRVEIDAMIPTPADIAAAICEAIVTARQLVVKSEVSDE